MYFTLTAQVKSVWGDQFSKGGQHEELDMNLQE
jgi:hypothetical protein